MPVVMVSIFGSEKRGEPVGNNCIPSQLHDSALEQTISCMAKTTNDSGSGGLCPDPRHHHCFRSIPFLMVPLYTCSGCGQRLQSYIFGGSSSPDAAVRCIACGVYAHRRCAFSKHIEWQTKCASANYDNNTYDDDDDDDDDGEEAEVHSIEHKDDTKIEQITESSQTMLADHDKAKEQLNTVENNMSTQPTKEMDNLHTKTSRGSLKTIFRSDPMKGNGSLDHHNAHTINLSMSVDHGLTSWRFQQDVQHTKANFPFLSLASLLPSHNVNPSEKSSIHKIRKCQTWNGVVESSRTHLDNEDDSAEESATKDSNSNTIVQPTNQSTIEVEITTPAPLHFASHGFRVVSKALQENICVHFDRLIPKENPNKQIDILDRLDENNVPNFERDDNSSVIETQSTNEEIKDDKDDIKARSLLETTEPQNDSAMDRKRIGIATVAGTIVGGVVGVGLAGPVGGVIGVKCGQTAGMLGLLLEGSVAASVLASGISVGIAAGQHIQEKHETRVLALGEGTKQRALLMVRPTIQSPEPIWDEIYKKARRSYSGNNDGIVNMLIPNESRAAKRERYEREVDIVETGEDELAIADKILLLASRILSNKDSLPGHVYRKLIEAFRCRCDELNLQDLDLKEQESVTTSSEDVSPQIPSSEDIEKDENEIDDKLFSRTHQRRRDAHAVIKYVTTSLLLTRPGFGCSSSHTEKTATAVESLVFGEIYDLVMEEIDKECQMKDDLLLDKIADFERKQGKGEDSAGESNDSCFGYKSCISEEALKSLHSLPQAHSAVDKLRYCVKFLEQISGKFSKSEVKSTMGADSLLKMVCQHTLLAKVIGINSQIAFLEEFARDEQLLRGREGYALVTLQASLHFLNTSENFESDIFNHDED